MKKMITLLGCLACTLLLAPVLSAANDCCTCTCDDDCCGFALTLKNGYFHPQECVLRQIFDRKGAKGGYWVEGALRWNCWRGLNIEASASHFSHKGYALCGNECTEVKLPTIGLGLKYYLRCADCGECCNACLDRLSFFVGGGLRVFFYRERNGSPYVRQCVEKTVVGGMVNLGVDLDVCNGLFLGLFLDYNGGKVKPDCDTCCNTGCVTDSSSNNACGYCCPSATYDINIGGVVFGISLGYKF